ncbi:MAG: hypothetical protein LBB39_03055 [Mycoplasmataceae bacterium]|jgi:hypothetical protein|nr:hypothetical protein [Mycoplasmataceae bacterium]
MEKGNLMKEREIIEKMTDDEFGEFIARFIRWEPVFDDKLYRWIEIAAVLGFFSLLIVSIGYVLGIEIIKEIGCICSAFFWGVATILFLIYNLN